MAELSDIRRRHIWLMRKMAGQFWKFWRICVISMAFFATALK
jgi:hypothetical protein